MSLSKKLQERVNNKIMPATGFALQIHVDNLLNAFTKEQIQFALNTANQRMLLSKIKSNATTSTLPPAPVPAPSPKFEVVK